MTIEFIDTPAALDDLCQRLEDAEWLAVDTEFLREKTYYPQLCLIQLATDDIVACVDPLAIEDLNPLLDVFYRDDITLVFHAARQDLELLYMERQALPRRIFDTQLAATVLGLGDQVGYGNLVKTCLNISLEKAHSRADWRQRPLSPEQLEYAADDVRYLRELYHQFTQQLASQNRTHWLDEDFAALSEPAGYEPDPDTIWKKVRGAGKLKPQQLAVLQRLAAWRERTAINKNRPRRWVLKDDIMLDIARFAPDNPQKLRKIRGFDERDINRYGDELIQVVEQARQIPKDDWPVIKKPVPLTHQQEALLDVLMGLLRKYCDEQSITPAAVAGRKDLEKLLRGETELDLMRGWRYKIIGHKLDDFLKGDIQITASFSELKTQ